MPHRKKLVFFGIMIRTGILKFKGIRMYIGRRTEGFCVLRMRWHTNDFFKLRAALPLPPKDKLWKVVPITEAIRTRSLALEPLAESSTDEPHW